MQRLGEPNQETLGSPSYQDVQAAPLRSTVTTCGGSCCIPRGFVVPVYPCEGTSLLQIQVSSASLVSNTAGDRFIDQSVLTGSAVMRPAS
ncbi:hypothetical protein Q31a_25320 [Aureliella helgolandensis]|uniref:Uncharacterized protein n=1 Tax=Aureliella helgolandensis TaxID=2527968 RepID=A0A518G6K0_9BACT|nr:hypothetical protein Q31a_25320 [Aureliella helgolandensis]